MPTVGLVEMARNILAVASQGEGQLMQHNTTNRQRLAELIESVSVKMKEGDLVEGE